LAEYKIEHIKASVKHPQSNGKVERLGRTLFQLKDAYAWNGAVNLLLITIISNFPIGASTSKIVKHYSKVS